jgi:hypothetical protein
MRRIARRNGNDRWAAGAAALPYRNAHDLPGTDRTDSVQLRKYDVPFRNSIKIIAYFILFFYKNFWIFGKIPQI